jgi:hypothetical protein
MGMAQVLSGLERYRVLAVAESTDEHRGHDPDDDRVDWIARRAERTAELMNAKRWSCVFSPVSGDRPGSLWCKQLWRCRDVASDARTWTERSERVDAQAVINRRATIMRAAWLVRTPSRSAKSRRRAGAVRCDGHEFSD